MEEISHKDIYDRLVAVEAKVDKIDTQTREVVSAFQSAKGAFIALDWLSKFAGRFLWEVIDDSQIPDWQDVDDSQDNDWTSVAGGSDVVWVEIPS